MLRRLVQELPRVSPRWQVIRNYFESRPSVGWSTCTVSHLIQQSSIFMYVQKASNSICYITDATILANPEKGFYHGYEIYSSSYPNYQTVDATSMQQWWTNEKISLVHLNYVLDSFVYSDITSTFLSKLTTDFQAVRSAGMKSIVRFSYTLTDGDMNDAGLTQLLRHISSLKPIFQVWFNYNSTVIVNF